MKIIPVFICLSLLLSCNPKAKETKTVATKPPDPTTASPFNCYRYASATDTITLKVIHIGNAITGTLVYSLKEKDENKGTIQGAMKDSILLADYTFMSEGVQSTRQVAFKLNGNSFTEGYGESIDQNGKMVFNSPDSLNFSASVKLSEIACQ